MATLYLLFIYLYICVQCCPLWPDGKTGDLQIAVGSSDAPRSQPFKFTEAHSTLLQLNGEVEKTCFMCSL